MKESLLISALATSKGTWDDRTALADQLQGVIRSVLAGFHMSLVGSPPVVIERDYLGSPVRVAAGDPEDGTPVAGGGSEARKQWIISARVENHDGVSDHLTLEMRLREAIAELFKKSGNVLCLAGEQQVVVETDVNESATTPGDQDEHPSLSFSGSLPPD